MTAPYQLLPNLAPDDFRRLKESIIEHGVQVPVIVDEDDNILDGHHRAMIADSLGLDCPREVRTGLNDAQKRILAAELNIARRHLTDAQKVQIGLLIEPDVAAEANRRMLSKLKNSPDSSLCANAQSDETGYTRDIIADKVGLKSGHTYDRAKKVLDQLAQEPDGEQLMTHIETGDWDLKDARKELKSRHPKDTPEPVAAAQPEPDQLGTDATVAVMERTGMSGTIAASAMLSIDEIVTTDVNEAAYFIVDLSRDVDLWLEAFPDVIRTMKDIARRAKRIRSRQKEAAA